MMNEQHFDEIQMKEDWQLQFIQKIILYRMDSVNTLHYALRLRSEWTNPPPMVIFVDGELVLEGNLNAFSNPAIEAGLIHFRALLEFLGLAEKNGMLTNRTRHKNGEDVGIKSFSDPNGRRLVMVDPKDALKVYGDKRKEVEKSLVQVIRKTNKALAHTTQELIRTPGDGALLSIACREIPNLMNKHFFEPLCLPLPKYNITQRTRDA
jgi:hypothetical protein